MLLIPGSLKDFDILEARAFQGDHILEHEASDYWERWVNSGKLSGNKASEYLGAYKRNLLLREIREPEWTDSGGHHRSVRDK